MSRSLAAPVTLAALFLHGACSQTPRTAEPNALTAEERAAGWRLLFDGKTMNGWEDPASKNPPGEAWVIEDGCLKAVKAPRLREDLFTLDSFENFELSFEWRISEGGNSGVKYRVQDRVPLEHGSYPEAKRFEDTVDYEIRNRRTRRETIPPEAKYEEYVVAFEYQVIDNSRHPDVKRGPDRAAGAIYSLVEPDRDVTKPVGEFNQSRIVLRGNRVEHWLNGEKVLEANLGDPAIAAKLAERWTTASPVYEMLTTQPKRRTPIGLQHHVDEVWFRSIKIREL